MTFNNELPYSNITDDSLSDELLPENNLHEGQTLVLDTDHIDYSALGNIDPDLNILLDNNTMICKYFAEMEFNNYFTTPDNFSLFNLNIRSLPKNVVNLQHFLEGININFTVLSFTLYRPPDVPPILFNEKLNDLLKMLQQENKTIFITGDFNINSSDAIINPNINVNNFQNVFLSYFYTPLIDKPTRVHKKRGTYSLLDNIYTNVTQITNTINCGVFKTDCSDHYSIFCVTDLVISTQKNKFVNKCDFSPKIFQIFIKLLINMSGIKYILITIKIHFLIFKACSLNVS